MRHSSIARHKIHRQCGFNLIEVILALTIVSVGMMAIVGLIPIGMNASRDAIGDNYAADAADQFLHLIAARAHDDWNNVIGGASSGLATTPPDVSEVAPRITTLQPATSPYNAGNGWKWIRDSTVYYILTSTSPTATTYTSTSPAGTIVYRVYQTRDSARGTGTIADFDAIVRIWKEPTSSLSYNGTSWTVVAPDTAYLTRALLNVELSWPASLPYSQRHRASYALEVVNGK